MVRIILIATSLLCLGCAKSPEATEAATEATTEAAPAAEEAAPAAEEAATEEAASDESHGDHEHEGDAVASTCSCPNGKAGEDIWCDGCKVGYAGGEKVGCEGCWKSATGGDDCAAHPATGE